MLDIFSGLRLVVKRRSISIDNAIFRCHWFFTSTLLVSFSLVITARQYVGQPIECHSVNKIPDSLLNSYCWVQSTFSVPQACNQQVGTEVPYPCIDNTRGREIKVFAYYQWVGMVLFIQGLMFHLPYYLWKVWENGLIRAITGGLRVAVLSDQEREKKKEIVVEYIHNHLGCHKQYAIKYFLCEFICLINLLAQLWATNRFFDGQFLRYGLSVMQYSSSSLGLSVGAIDSAPSFNQTTLPRIATQAGIRNLIQPAQLLPQQPQQQQATAAAVDPMTFIFPRITKCTYYDFGSSGDVQKHDALCLLPLNIINEKIYIALWFWFLVLALLTLLVIIYRLLAISSEQVRCKGLLSRCKLSNELDIRIICRHCDVGDWFLFYMVAENLDPLIMREIVNDIANKIRAHFELKRELSMLHGDSEADRDSMYKFRPPAVDFRWRYRGTNSQSFDESRASTRRSSLADEVPLVRKLKKRLHPKRLWSVDMGTSGLQPFSQQQQQQQPTPPTPSTPPSSELPRPTAPIMRGQSITSSGTVSVGALSPGELESAPPPPPPPPPPQAQSSQQAQHHDQQRRAELTRAASTTSSTASTATVESYVMEMQPMSRPSAELCASRLERRPSSHGQRPPLLRQRNSQSIASIRDLRLNHSPATAAAAAAAGLEP